MRGVKCFLERWRSARRRCTAIEYPRAIIIDRNRPIGGRNKYVWRWDRHGWSRNDLLHSHKIDVTGDTVVRMVITMFRCVCLRKTLNHKEGKREEDRKGLYEPVFRHDVILLHQLAITIPFRQSKEALNDN